MILATSGIFSTVNDRKTIIVITTTIIIITIVLLIINRKDKSTAMPGENKRHSKVPHERTLFSRKLHRFWYVYNRVRCVSRYRPSKTLMVFITRLHLPALIIIVTCTMRYCYDYCYIAVDLEI